MKIKNNGFLKMFLLLFSLVLSGCIINPAGNIGEKGDTGPQGEQGVAGESGKSAYELYCEAHPEYAGEEDDWLDDLVNGRLGSKDVFTVSFDSDGGTVIENQTVELFGKVTAPIVEKEDFLLDGWYFYGEKWNFERNFVFEDMTLVAVWKSNVVTVSFDFNIMQRMGTLLPREYTIGEPFELPKITTPVLMYDYLARGYVFYYFVGWTYNDEIIVDGIWTIDHNVTLVGKWTFESDEQIYLVLNVVIYDDKLDILDFDCYSVYKGTTEYDYFFDLINEKRYLEEPEAATFDIVLSYYDIVIEDLKWWDESYSIRINIELFPKKFEVTLDYNGGTVIEGEQPPTVEVTYGYDYTLPALEHPDGDYFVGWFYEDLKLTNNKGESYYFWDILSDDPIVLKAIFEKPIFIESVNDLELIRDNPNAIIEFIKDIDLSGVSWEPIARFCGTVLGNEHVISGLVIDDLSRVSFEYNDNLEYFAGFFALLENAEIHDLHFEDVDISIEMNFNSVAIGTVAGAVANSKISSVTVNSNSIIQIKEGDAYYVNDFFVGGLFGYAYNLLLEDVHNSATVSVPFEIDAFGPGGLVGHNVYRLIMYNCSNKGDVVGSHHVGGLVGFNSGQLNIYYSFNSGDIIGKYNVGGFVGLSGYGYITIEHCYNKGDITGGYNVGGLIGMIDSYHWDLLFIKNTFNSGTIRGIEYVGGLVGLADIFDAEILKVFNTGDIYVVYMSVGDVFGEAYFSSMNYGDVYFTGTIYDYEGNLFDGYINEYASHIDISVLTNSFLIDKMGFSEDYWDFSDVDIPNGNYPTLLPAPTDN